MLWKINKTISNSQFKDWATDVPNEYIDVILNKWKGSKPSPKDVAEVETLSDK